MLISLVFNPVSLILSVPVILILVKSLFTPFNHERISSGFYSIVNSFEFIAALIIALLITRGILFDRNNSAFTYIFNLLPGSVKASLVANNIYTYLCIASIVLIIVVIVLRLITYPLYAVIFDNLAYKLYRAMNSLSSSARRIISFICSIPKAFVTLVLISFIFYFFSYYFTVPGLSRYIDESAILNKVYDTALRPVIASDIAKKIPVIINDRFNSLDINNGKNIKIAENIRDTLDSYNIKVIQYFNGVTLDDAVKSTPEIDKLALLLTKDERNDYDKCRKIYDWITKNISYDYEKSDKIARETSSTNSGTIICYQTGKGICFDFSSLFISMCKANSIKVNLVTGLGYSGMSWGDHAWNQFYCESEKRWVNVDTTFGASGADYFDSANFSLDHKNSKIQGEW
ncbi:transglutaminase superfamily protein [Ruminiclostridium sufflavum DSM 19573]|uniref:Transglutaminase superfamily protein n=1 Tax=Ruminiclostridium sufflavum DSM 19573 TaxID=1121337 RepID=A0A318XLS9_9FIRM|nr:transglutaminase-like domain-containing protein [Ruminiclostridium sufflavum]PYG88583.1 transglutaminase superfamily protein [Ruminiclostridium sufflavum DSM 19573]